MINATPLGMRPGDAAPVTLSELGGSMFVGDVVTVTAPGDTPLIIAAKSAGCASCSGHDMFTSTLDLMLDFFLEPAPPASRAGL